MSKSIEKIRLGMASCGIAAGATAVLELLKAKTDLPIEETGCIGHCYAEPIAEVIYTDGSSQYFGNLKAEDAYIDSIVNGTDFAKFNIHEGRKSKELVKVLALAGKINPVSFEDYCANDTGHYTAPLVRLVQYEWIQAKANDDSHPHTSRASLAEDWPWWCVPELEIVKPEIQKDPRWDAWVSKLQ